MSIIKKPVLVLNKAWAPIHVLPVFKAVIRACNNRADIIDPETYMRYPWEEWMLLKVVGDQPYIKTASEPFKIRAPQVIVANEYSKVPKRSIKLNRDNLWARDGGRCQYTGRKLKKSEADIDHVIPRSKGGANSWDNTVLCDKEVNAKKANKTPEEAGLELLKKPSRPSWSPIFKFKNSGIPKSWEPFLVKNSN